MSEVNNGQKGVWGQVFKGNGTGDNTSYFESNTKTNTSYNGVNNTVYNSANGKSSTTDNWSSNQTDSTAYNGENSNGNSTYNEVTGENSYNTTNTQNASNYGSFGSFGQYTNNETQGFGNDTIYQPVSQDKAITKQGLWSKVRNFLFQEIDLTAPIKIELTPYQKKVEDEINEFLHQEVSFKGIFNIFKSKNNKK